MPEYKDIVYIDWTLVFTIVNTVITFFIVKHLLYKPVKKVLDARKNEVAKIYNDANQASEKATELKQQYETQIATARDQAADIIATANKRAQLKYDEVVVEAGQKASATLLRAEKQLDIDKKRAVDEAKSEIAELAIGAAARVIKKEIDQKTHEKLIEDFIENAGDIEWQS